MRLRSEVGVHPCFVCGRPVALDAPGTVKARRVIYSVGMNGDRRHVNGPEALFHMNCFAEESGLWLVIT
jgi:hypothetical protein